MKNMSKILGGGLKGKDCSVNPRVFYLFTVYSKLLSAAHYFMLNDRMFND